MEQAAGIFVGRTALLTGVAMAAFAANSIFCRMALARGSIDPASFTLLRLASGAMVLYLLNRRRPAARVGGTWAAAAALLIYAACFSFAYTNLAAGTGAILLFGATQATMVLQGLLSGERLGGVAACGLILAFGGLVVLVAPGVTAPDPASAFLMIAAGIGWGTYSLLGRGLSDPLASSAGNFLRALPFAVPLLFSPGLHGSAQGVAWAVLSGGITSGLGYVVWYSALRGLTASKAASVQLSVPVITAIGGVLFLAEPLSLRVVISSLAVLGGIALVVGNRRVRLAVEDQG